VAASLSQRLGGHQTVGLDTSVFIYHLEAHPQYVSLTRELLSTIRNSKWWAVTSTVTLMELTVRAWEESRPDLACAYEIFLSRFPHLLLADVTRGAARRADFAPSTDFGGLMHFSSGRPWSMRQAPS
jgi:hypothetical protein